MAGRPRKIASDSAESQAEDQADAQAAEVETPELPDLKDCPACGAPAKAPYLDIHGLFRCHCSAKGCGFGDCYPRYTPLEAAEMWNAIGGPNPPQD